MRPERFVVPCDLLNIEALLVALLLSSLFLFSVHAQKGDIVARAQTYAGAFDPAPETTRPPHSEPPDCEMSVRMPGSRMIP